MEPFQFACPYCSGQFEIEHPLAGQAVACPHCGEDVGLPAESPPSAEELPASDTGEDPDAALRFIEPLRITMNVSGQSTRQRSARPARRQLSREERDRLRTRRNLLLMVGGIIVLSVAAALLSRV